MDWGSLTKRVIEFDIFEVYVPLASEVKAVLDRWNEVTLTPPPAHVLDCVKFSS